MSSNISEKLKTINQTLKKLNNHISIIENNKRKIVLYNNSNKNLASLNLSILDKKRKKLFNLDKIYRLKLDNKAQNESITDLVKSYQSKYRVVISGGESLEEIDEEELLKKTTIAKNYNDYEDFILKSQLDYHKNN